MTTTASNIKKTQVCRNCKSVYINNYCSDCGQRVYTKRFTIKSFFYVILSTLSIERGFFYTAKMLFTHPGKVVKDYISGKTKSYYNPLKYLIIVAGIYAFLMIWLKILDANYEEIYKNISSNNESLENSEEILQMQKKVINVFKQFINFIPILMIPFASLSTKWFYSSKKLFYGEHLILNCFLFAQIFILYILWSPIVVIIPALITYFPYITGISSIIYLCYALNKTFHESILRSITKGILIYFSSTLLFFLFIIIISLIALIVMILL